MSATSTASRTSLTSILAGLIVRRKKSVVIRRVDLAFLIHNLATLLENGLSLPKALATLAAERTLRKHATVLDDLRRRVEMGETFSSALSRYSDSFGEMMVSQVKVGEKTGRVGEALMRISAQLEKTGTIRSAIIKKLAYPMVVVLGGAASVTFMLMFVIPVFQETYAGTGVPLPLITRTLIVISGLLQTYWWMILLLVAMSFLTLRMVRSDYRRRLAMDRWLLKIPIVGTWMRDVAVLQFMDAFGTLLESGYNVVDALIASPRAVGNLAVRDCVDSLRSAVNRGERFSRELERQNEYFPPVVSQLVVVGEQTGSLAKATADIRRHLRREIERNVGLAVGTIEPVLTIGMAVTIGVILLAIYLPMFDMINVVK